MSKKKRRKKVQCDTDNCLVHKWWPAVKPGFGSHACYYIEPNTGEVIVNTGLRALPDLETVDMDMGVNEWVKVQCSCGKKAAQRVDLLQSGKVTSCPACAATKAFSERN